MKHFFGALAFVLTFALFLPYIRSILRGEVKPHLFSWIIWGLGTFVVCFAQLSDGGGAGALVIGVSGLISSYIAWLAYLKRGDTTATPSDRAFLVMAIAALPLWYFTESPLLAVIILTTIDLLGFGPTIRKAYGRPHEESLGFFALSALRNLLVVLALENYSLTTVLFPAAVGVACLFLVLFLGYRRRFVDKNGNLNRQ